MNKFKTTTVRPEPLGYAQESPVEGQLAGSLLVPLIATGFYTTFLYFKYNELQNNLTPSPAGQILRERLWSREERPQGSGQESPETLGWGEGNKIN